MIAPFDHLACAAARVRLRGTYGEWVPVPLVLPTECCCGHGAQADRCRNRDYCPAGTMCANCAEDTWLIDYQVRIPLPVEVGRDAIDRIMVRRQQLGVQWADLAEATGLAVGTISSMAAKVGRQRVHLDALGYGRLMRALDLEPYPS